MIHRNLSVELGHSKKSILLLGPRQVGKSTLIHSLSPDLSINLADQAEYFRITSSPKAPRIATALILKLPNNFYTEW